MDSLNPTTDTSVEQDPETRLMFIEAEYWQLRDKYDKLQERIELLEKAAGIFHSE